MARSVLDDLATWLCSLRAEPANAEVIRELIWVAYDAAAVGDLLASERAVVSARAELAVAQRAVGLEPVPVEAVVTLPPGSEAEGDDEYEHVYVLSRVRVDA